jgi:hypothetical protein
VGRGDTKPHLGQIIAKNWDALPRHGADAGREQIKPTKRWIIHTATATCIVSLLQELSLAESRGGAQKNMNKSCCNPIERW